MKEYNSPCPTCGVETRWWNRRKQTKHPTEPDYTQYSYQCDPCRIIWQVFDSEPNTPKNIQWKNGQPLDGPAPKIQKSEIMQWIRDNGNIIRIHVEKFAMFRVSITPGELGINTDDLRGRGLSVQSRRLIFKHKMAHYYHYDGESNIYIGFDDALKQPKAIYFNKSASIKAIQYPIGNDWISFEKQGRGRWINLEPPEGWRPSPHFGNVAYWIALKVKPGEFPDSMIECDPIRSLASLERKARRNIASYGHELESLGLENYNWIGHRAWPLFIKEWTEYQDELRAIKAYLTWRHREFEDKLADDFSDIAKEAWAVMSASHRKKVEANYKEMNLPEPEAGSDALNFIYQYISYYGKSVTIDGKRNFIDYVVEKATDKMPDVDKIEEINMQYSTVPLLLQVDLARDHLTAAKMEQEAQQALALAEEAESEKEITQAKKRLELTKIASEKEAMRQAAIERAREQIAEVSNPLDEMLDNVRAEMFKAVATLAEVYQDKGKLSSRQIKQARELIERFRLLNSHGDEELETKLTELADQLPKGKGVGEPEQFANAMQGIITLTQESADRVLKTNVAEDYGVENIRL